MSDDEGSPMDDNDGHVNAKSLKKPHETATNDEVAAGMRVLQEQLKSMRKSLVVERMIERERETSKDGWLEDGAARSL